MKTPFEEIFLLGEQIQEALAADDLDTFFDLVDKRDHLVKNLKKPAIEAAGNTLEGADAQILEKQFKEIISALNKKEEQMLEQLHQLDRFKKAGSTYGATKRRQFINKKLLG